MNILNLFETQVATSPHAVAAIYQDKLITYEALNEKANGLAHKLRQRGFRPETQVGLCMDRGIDVLIAMLGILKAGGAYVPLDPIHPMDRLHCILQTSDILLLITTSNYQPLFSAFEDKILLYQENQPNEEVEPRSISIKPSQLAYIIYTSGSTGVPKGVLVEHHSVVSYAQWFVAYSGLQPGQRIDWSSNYIFDMSVTSSIVPLMLGLTIVICHDDTKKNIQNYFNYLRINQIHAIKITPSYFKMMIQHESPLLDLTTIILGGENLQAGDCKAWLKSHGKHTLFNEYGPTEATVAVTQQKISKDNCEFFTTSIPIGKPGPQAVCYILNSKKQPVIQDEIGELYIGGACLARGYMHQAALTRQKFIKNPFSKAKSARLYKTGDLCRWLEDGSIEYIGRRDKQIKIRGYRVELSEIERRLILYPAIKDAIVLLRKTKKNQQHLIAYCILNTRYSELNYTEIRHFLMEFLTDYMVPSAFVVVKSFPLSASGKLDENALPTPALLGSQRYHPPQARLEKKLATIWSRELELELVGMDDNFYELGGHSLNAARILSDVKRELDSHVTMQEFFEAETIANLVKVIRKKRRHKQENARVLPSMPERGLMPLSDFQLLLWLSKTFEPGAQKLNMVSRKRFKGCMDAIALRSAVTSLFQRHEILLYHTTTFYPAQYALKEYEFNLIEACLVEESKQVYERLLFDSLNELTHYKNWSKQSPLLVVKLFQLPNQMIELQVCIPHLITDEVSLDLFWSDLSAHYLQHKTHSTQKLIAQPIPFRTYIEQERREMATRFVEDYSFWKKQLSDLNLFTFPREAIVKNPNPADFHYSSYFKLSPELVSGLNDFSLKYHLGIEEILCAAVGLALDPYKSNSRCKNLLINMIKSARDNPLYDNTIGCFLRVDPFKVNFEASNLLNAARSIHHLLAKTSHFLRASTMLKLLCVPLNDGRRKKIIQWFAKGCLYVYCKLLSFYKLDYQALLYCHNLVGCKHAYYIINVNILNGFILSNKGQPDAPLFGLNETSVPMHQQDMLSLKNFFDVTFMRDEAQQTPYLVISSNLTPAFRKQIAKQIIRIISEHVPGDRMTS